MKQLLIMMAIVCIIAPMSTATDKDRVAPNLNQIQKVNSSPGVTPFSMGDVNWTLDVSTPTGDPTCEGVTFDGINYWITGAGNLVIPYLYEVTPGGTLVNSYMQPTVNWGSWAWGDITTDGQFLYVGDSNGPYILQVDPATGNPTGVQYGPFPVSPSFLALAYDKNTDSFWGAYFSSDIYQCFRNGTSNVFSNPGLVCFGAAFEEQTGTNLLWIWSQDGPTGNQNTGTQIDPLSGVPTGLSFIGDPKTAGIAGGACAYSIGTAGTEWEFCGLHQTGSDTIVAYDLYPLVDSLELDNDHIKSWIGGTANFDLNAGAPNGNREYLLLGSLSYIPGVSPGIPLKAGAVLPITWDIFTSMLLGLNLPVGNLGTLSSTGEASALFIMPVIDPPFSFDMTFAFCLRKPGGLNFASNYVQITVEDWLQPTLYQYDDGVGDNLYGYGSGGEICFLQEFDSGPVGDTIEKLSNAYGSALYVGYGMGNGHPTNVYIWNDPTPDGEPSDCVLLDSVASTIQFEDQDIFVETMLNTPQVVTGFFAVGVMMDHTGTNATPATYVCPMDMSNLNFKNIWLIGDPGNAAGGFDYTILSNNAGYSQITDGVWMLRAIPQ